MAEGLLVLFALVAFSLAGMGWIAHKLGLPPALGYLVTGIAFAPAVTITPDVNLAGMDFAAEIGVLIVLFFIGLELDLRTLRKVLGTSLGASALDIVLPAALVLAIGQLLGWDFRQALILGLAASVSSTIFGDRLSAQPNFPRAGRQRNFGILIGEDLAAGVMLALLALLAGTGGGGWSIAIPIGRIFFFLILAAAAALLVVPRLLDAVSRSHIQELVLLTALVCIIGFGLVGEWLGSAELGAFLAGMAAAEAGSRFVIRNALATVRDLGMALFFVAAGLHVELHGMVDEIFPILAIAGAFLLAKLVVHVPSAMATGMNASDGLRTALGLGAIGEFSLIFVAAASRQGLAHPLLNTYIVGVMLVLLFVTPTAMNIVPRLGPMINRLPLRVTRPLRWFLRSVAREKAVTPQTDGLRRQLVRRLLANVILLLAWGLLVAAAAPRIVAALPTNERISAILIFGLAISVASPLFYFGYRAYRDLVRTLVGVSDAQDAAGRVRARIVDAWVVATGVVLLLPISLVLPSTFPVLVGGFLLALVIVGVAWRNLSRFHGALERSVTRVLGHEAGAEALLEEVLRKYPWGVRFAAVAIPAESPMANSTLQETRLTELTGALVAVHHSRGQEIVNPGPNARILAGDTLVLLGRSDELEKAEALIVAHGQAIQATVRSRLASLVEIPVEAGSAAVGQTLGSIDVQGKTGALVVGLWPNGADHPEAFRPDLVVGTGDHLILLGSALQVERARGMTLGA